MVSLDEVLIDVLVELLVSKCVSFLKHQLFILLSWSASQTSGTQEEEVSGKLCGSGEVAAV